MLVRCRTDALMPVKRNAPAQSRRRPSPLDIRTLAGRGESLLADFATTSRCRQSTTLFQEQRLSSGGLHNRAAADAGLRNVLRLRVAQRRSSLLSQDRLPGRQPCIVSPIQRKSAAIVKSRSAPFGRPAVADDPVRPGAAQSTQKCDIRFAAVCVFRACPLPWSDESEKYFCNV